MTQDDKPADKPEKGEKKKENIYVPSLVEAQAEIAAKRGRIKAMEDGRGKLRGVNQRERVLDIRANRIERSPNFDN